MPASDTQRAIEAIWRIESAKVIARLARLVRDVGLAEDLAHDALVAALEQWPQAGVPDNPGAWLLTTAKHRAIDHLRRHQLRQRKHAELHRRLDADRQAALPGQRRVRLELEVCSGQREPRPRFLLGEQQELATS
jgi:predicted RNA polymerase sigma factor